MPMNEKLSATTYRLKGTLGWFVNQANYEPGDAVMVEFARGRDMPSDGAVVVLKGPEMVEAFRQWAQARNSLKPDRAGKLAQDFEKRCRG